MPPRLSLQHSTAGWSQPSCRPCRLPAGGSLRRPWLARRSSDATICSLCAAFQTPCRSSLSPCGRMTAFCRRTHHIGHRSSRLSVDRSLAPATSIQSRRQPESCPSSSSRIPVAYEPSGRRRRSSAGQAIIEAMHAVGYDLVTCNAVEPWIYEKDKKNPRADTMFFQMRSDGPPLESLPPSYEEAVAETSGPTGFGGMAGSPQPLAPFPQPAIDMSDLTLLALHDAESIILVSSQSQILSPAVLQTINTVLPNGLKEEQIKQGTVYAVPRFKLKGNPFWYGYTAPVASKRLIVTLLARFANYGLRVVTDVSTMSTSKVSTFVFGNAPPVRRAPHFGLAFSDVNKIQLIALNKGDPNALTALEMLYAESVIVETLQEITARDCVRDDLDGVIEWTAPRESFDLQSNDSDSMRRTRLFVGLVIAGMASLGWAVVSTPSLGVYGQQSDVVVFARFE
ncbi:hypothetical protein BC831DRAFT_42371 [Entophlyctis helioformis]|nr:hypothetical protein BC831DRAFT_42371 [Entophlyctis helioformis]